MVKKSLVIYILFVILFIVLFNSSLIFAENLNLKITGIVNNITSDVYLKTNPNATDFVDSYDMYAKDLPSGNYSQFYSSVSSQKLSIDSWASNPRTVYLVYSLSADQNGNLSFSWPALTGSYDATFTYYGTDSSYATSVGSVNMRTGSSYSASIGTGSTLYYVKVSVTSYVAPTSTPDSGTGSGGGGGSGGGNASTKLITPDLVLNRQEINVKIRAGETVKEVLNIKNDFKDTNIYIELTGSIKNFIILSNQSFTLKKGENKDIPLIIAVLPGTKPDVYLGTLIVNYNGKTQHIPVAISVSSKDSLFDIKVTIPEGYKVVKPGSEILVNLLIFNLGDIKRVDGQVQLMIKDSKEKVISSQKEMVAVETQTSLSRTIRLPAFIKEGDYFVVAKIVYGNSTGVSSDSFKIQGKMDFGFIFIIFIVIVVAVVIYLLYRFIFLKRALGSENYSTSSSDTRGSYNWNPNTEDS